LRRNESTDSRASDPSVGNEGGEGSVGIVNPEGIRPGGS
jgi:hypothetical protein